METVVGLVMLVALIVGARRLIRSGLSQSHGAPGPQPARPSGPRSVRPSGAQPVRPPGVLPTPQPGRERQARPPDVIGGWIVGHHIANGHTGFAGDPLPGGHLGSPANLAFWGSVFDDDDEDDFDP